MPFIIKMNKRDEIIWSKKVPLLSLNTNASFATIAEAENGNIFFAAINPAANNERFTYIVISPAGNVLSQYKLGIANNAVSLTNASISISLVSRFGPDSMLFVLIHPVNSVTTDGMTLLTVSNNGQIGHGAIFAPPILTTSNSFIVAVKLKGIILFYMAVHNLQIVA
jgi:hypothetical protein